ncbi:hypothetical protein D5038_19815 [Verminephrobacter aporrectodeae subsp. tuberculatae]|nr:hypothetical protein [Verminephrobacter aporrectodeae subsp. tuberculatae]
MEVLQTPAIHKDIVGVFALPWRAIQPSNFVLLFSGQNTGSAPQSTPPHDPLLRKMGPGGADFRTRTRHAPRLTPAR